MGLLSKCGLFVALSAALSIVFFTGSSASAATPNYDIMLETTDVLDIPSYCDPELRLDFSTNYKELITESRHWQYGGEDVKQAQYSQAYSESESGGGIMWLKNMDNVIQALYSPTGIEFDWTEVPGEVYAKPVGGGQNLYRSDFQNVDVGFGCQVVSWQSTKEWQNAIGHQYGVNGNVDIKIFASIGNVNANYPEGYSGVEVPGAGGTIGFKPNMTWTVNDLDVTFYSDDTKNSAALPPDYQIYWFFSNTTFNTVQPSEPFAVSGCTDPAYVNAHTVPEYFDYGLQAYYADKDCNILSQDLDGNILSEQMEVLPIDGSTFEGSSATDSGYVEESKLVTAIKNISIDQHGLQSLVLAPAQLFTQMATWSGQCSTINLPFIEGKSLSLQCVRSGFSNQYPIIYGTIQVVMSGLIAYFVAIKTFRVIKGANDPEDDKVETYKL